MCEATLYLTITRPIETLSERGREGDTFGTSRVEDASCRRFAGLAPIRPGPDMQSQAEACE